MAGGVLDYYEFGSLEYIIIYFFEALCIVAVNVFVLISGYFSVEGKFRLSRIIKFALQIFTYSILCNILALTVFKHSFSASDLFKAIIPLTTGQYWFASAFIVMMVCSPIINMTVRRLSARQMKILVGIIACLFSFLPTIMPWSRLLLTAGYDYSWFVVLYIIGAFIRLHKFTLKRPFAIYFGCSAALTFSRIIIGLTTKIAVGKTVGENTLYAYSSTLVLLSSIALFIGFLQMKEGKVSQYFAPVGRLVFGAYIISDHNIIRNDLWRKLDLYNLQQNGMLLMIAGVAFVALMIVCVGTISELIRIWLMGKSHLNDLIERIDNTRINHAINQGMCDTTNE